MEFLDEGTTNRKHTRSQTVEQMMRKIIGRPMAEDAPNARKTVTPLGATNTRSELGPAVLQAERAGEDAGGPPKEGRKSFGLHGAQRHAAMEALILIPIVKSAGSEH